MKGQTLSKNFKRNKILPFLPPNRGKQKRSPWEAMDTLAPSANLLKSALKCPYFDLISGTSSGQGIRDAELGSYTASKITKVITIEGGA